mmetsp:Transcript_27209/g.93516  ORF Transcript_27209/g.93516 Transcript_27209/m.93516 type:complete len:571 (-) Transcript_27209:157-1869(-)
MAPSPPRRGVASPAEVRFGRVDGCAVAVPEEMLYWRQRSRYRDRDLVKSGVVLPALSNPQKYLTFVPDPGGWNNVRLGFENALVIARSTGRTLVLPPMQTFYLLTDCKANCYFTVDDFLPALMQKWPPGAAAEDVRLSVISNQEFFEDHVPRLARDGRLKRATGLGPGDAPPYPLPDKVQLAVRRCTPTNKSPDSCFPLYRWLDDYFRAGDSTWTFPDTNLQCLVFGNASSVMRLGAAAAKKAQDDFCSDLPAWPYDGILREKREAFDGDALFGTSDAILHIRSAGVNTHWAPRTAEERKNRVDTFGKSLEPAHFGRLLAPWYAYLLHSDPAVSNFYKRFVRDFVRFDEARVVCAAAAIVNWVRSEAPTGFSALHARRNDFQFKESSSKGGEALLRAVERVVRPGEALFIATDEKNSSFFDPIRQAGHRVFLLADLLEALRAAPGTGDAAGPPWELLDALSRVNGNELGFVDTLVSAHGRTFTASWFSTFSSMIQRIRGYAGMPDNSTYFTTDNRWAAQQGFENFRRPYYCKEWVEAWRNIEGDEWAKPYPGERVWTIEEDVSANGYNLR